MLSWPVLLMKCGRNARLVRVRFVYSGKKMCLRLRAKPAGESEAGRNDDQDAFGGVHAEPVYC